MTKRQTTDLEKKQQALQRLHDAEADALVQKVQVAEKFDEEGLTGSFIELLDAVEITPRQKRFLTEFCLSGVPSVSAKRAGVSMRSVYDWRQESDFEDYYQECQKIANDRLEYEALRLSTGYYEKPVVSLGRVVAYERIYDTKVLMALLRARNPEKFAQKVDITSNGQSLIKYVDKDAWDSI